MTSSRAAQLTSLRETLIRLLMSVAVAVVALAISLIAVAFAGESPVEAVQALLEGAFGSRSALAATTARLVPLILVALGWIVAFSTRRVSLGFEGQILAGGAVATLVGLNFGGLPPVLHLTLAILAGIIGGMVWVLPPVILWARNGVHEIISTILMTLIAFEVISWAVRGPLQEDTGAFARTNPILPGALWPSIGSSSLHWDILLVAGLLIATWILLRKTTVGLRLRFVGANPTAARYLGVESKRVSAYALLASGGFAGLAGSSLILASETENMAPGFSAGYGFEGIVVALLARNNPIAVIPAAFLFAVLRQGSGLLEARVGVSSAVVTLSLGLIVILMASGGAALAAWEVGKKSKASRSQA